MRVAAANVVALPRVVKLQRVVKRLSARKQTVGGGVATERVRFGNAV